MQNRKFSLTKTYSKYLYKDNIIYEEETLHEKCKNCIYNLIKLSNPEKLILC